MYEFGFIGCGHMGSELVRIAAAAGAGIALADTDTERVSALVEECRELAGQAGGLTCCDTAGQAGDESGAAQKIQLSSAEEICAQCKYIVLGVRPQQLPELAAQIGGILQQRLEGKLKTHVCEGMVCRMETADPALVLVTMLAGKSIEKVREYLGVDAPTIRIMPNTPIKLGKGVILYAGSENVSEEDLSRFTAVYDAAGSLIPVPEEDIDAGSVLSGCGPAYVYRFIEAFAKAGQKLGFTEEEAVRLVCETAIGSAEMILQTGKTPDTLCSEVCSKGGTTEQGVMKIDASDFEDIMDACVQASYNKTLSFRD